jgi:farnesyl diphosphate synthase
VSPDSTFDLGDWSARNLVRVEHALKRWISLEADPEAGVDAPQALNEAMRYATLDGGKRLRPLLVLAAAEAVQAESPTAALPPGTDEQAALRAACAVELIHAYSLVHDDLPCMDNDVLRRGKPTVHVKFGEASALLAGDALQALAFELLTPSEVSVPARLQAQLCRLLARAAGRHGMAGGQAIDLASVGLALSECELRQMHRLKTGALLQASVMMGAACGRASKQALGALASYGAAVGLAFQVVDDILDVSADAVALGKTPGKDAQQHKPTYVSLLGLARSTRYAQELLSQALADLGRSGLGQTLALQGLAKMLVNRVA